MKTREIEVTEETEEIVRSFRREGEDLEETLNRLALAFRASGLMSYDPTKQRRKGSHESSNAD